MQIILMVPTIGLFFILGHFRELRFFLIEMISLDSLKIKQDPCSSVLTSQVSRINNTKMSRSIPKRFVQVWVMMSYQRTWSRRRVTLLCVTATVNAYPRTEWRCASVRRVTVESTARNVQAGSHRGRFCTEQLDCVQLWLSWGSPSASFRRKKPQTRGTL